MCHKVKEQNQGVEDMNEAVSRQIGQGGLLKGGSM